MIALLIAGAGALQSQRLTPPREPQSARRSKVGAIAASTETLLHLCVALTRTLAGLSLRDAVAPTTGFGDTAPDDAAIAKLPRARCNALSSVSCDRRRGGPGSGAA